MNAAEQFAGAIPEPVQILGLRLKPFCLGHYIIMARFKVAFVAEEEMQAILQDLILGVLICSMTYEGFMAFIDGGDFREQLAAWGKQVGLDFDFAEKVALFNDYLAKAMKQPVIIYEESASESGAHWTNVVKSTLIGPCGYTMSEALNLPLPQAFMDFYKHAESNGVISIATDGVAELLQQEDECPA